MARIDKLKQELKACNGPYPYKDAIALLRAIGYVQTSTGGGSRRRFVHEETKAIIRLHEPHPGTEIPAYMVKQIRDLLLERKQL